jgi:hypothetical protein
MKENNQEKTIKRPSSTSFPSPASPAQFLLPPRSVSLPGLLACPGHPSPLASARFPAPQRAAQLPRPRPTPLPPCAASSSRPRPNALVHPAPPLVAQRGPAAFSPARAPSAGGGAAASWSCWAHLSDSPPTSNCFPRFSQKTVGRLLNSPIQAPGAPNPSAVTAWCPRPSPPSRVAHLPELANVVHADSQHLRPSPRARGESPLLSLSAGFSFLSTRDRGLLA